MAATAIIGGGAIGLSLAYHLARRGARDVLLLERNQLTSGTSWHAAGIVGPLRATPNMTRLAMRALSLLPELERETGLSIGYRQTGGFWLARRPERMDELHRIAALGRHFGLGARIVEPCAVAAAIPAVDASGLVGALSVAEDASVDPVGLCMAYAKAARAAGVEIRENAAVARLLRDGERVAGVRLADGSEIAADRVALCAGAWSKRFAEGVGVALPLQPVEHMYVVTEPMPDLPQPFPALRDLDRGIYLKGDAGRLVIGGFEPDAKCWDPHGPEGDRPFLELAEDWDQFTPFMEAALALIPILAETGVQRFMNGPESFAVDTKPLIGAAPEVDGLYVAAGMNSVGVMSSAGVGDLLAGWMLDGAPAMDAWEVDIARVDPLAASAEHMQARMEEAVADLFDLHWPFKQPKAGRGLRRSCLHDRWAREGAVFGLTAGWERGLWYAEREAERSLPYSIGAQRWRPIVDREAARLSDGAVLLDLSPFTKIDVTGADAPAFLNWLASARIDVAIGRTVYTPLLNAAGGIEADVTISRLGETEFRIISGAATRRRDLAWLRRQAAGCAVSFEDRTEAEAVIGVMGAASRAVLESLSEDDWRGFPFTATRPVTVAGFRLRATRLSFVGELGWELSIGAANAGAVFDALIDAGARPMGHYALDGCRLEKGFKHWGHDLGPEITPLEAGLGFAIDWSKAFQGRERLEAQREEGLRRRLVLFEVEGDPLMLHDEPIRRDGRVVGLTTSGGGGPRTELTLAFGLIETAPGASLAEIADAEYEIEVAAERCPAHALRTAPFDSTGSRMKA